MNPDRPHLSYEAAIQIITQSAKSAQENLAAEIVHLDDAVGRITSSGIQSAEVVPPYANSAMDGFAVHSQHTSGASPSRPLRFKVAGIIVAGDAPPEKASSPEEVWEIMTGAPFPPGFDAAIKIEDVKVTRDADGMATEIEISKFAEPWQNYRDAGEDFEKGTPVLDARTQIKPEHVLGLAALGVSKLQVQRKLKVALISTGRELALLGDALKPGQIRNSSAHFLKAALRRFGADCAYYGVIKDDPDAFSRMMRQVLRDAPDVILSTGAVSMGKHDFIGQSLKEMGAEIVFHKVAIRPGKPILFARLPDAGPAFFGLPGNPVSTVVGLKFFVEPYLRELQGRAPEKPIRARYASNEKPGRKPEGLRCFYKAKLSFGDGEPGVEILAGQLSFMVRPLLEANAWAVLREVGDHVNEGEWVDVYPMEDLRL